MPHLIIQAAQAEVAEAEAKLRNAIEHVRKTCTHDKVWEVPYVHMDWVSDLRGRRMCMCCGLEEEERYGWAYDKDKALRDSETRTVKVIDRDTFYNKRIE